MRIVPTPFRRRFAFAALAATCVAALALAASAGATGGTVKGWGFNQFGQIGNGVTSSTGCQCVNVPTAPISLSEVVQVSGGRELTLALLADGSVKSWGSNSLGNLGNGTTTPSNTPVSVTGLSNAVQIAASAYGGFALLADGTVRAWGENTDGDLGLGSLAGPEACGSPCSKVPVQVPGLTDVVAIDASGASVLALRADGTVLGWGFDYYGNLGDAIGTVGPCGCVDHPVQVPGVSGALAISAGSYGGSALLADGSIVDWGLNEYGELGNGDRFLRLPCGCLGPQTVKGLTGATQTVTGGYHAMALTGQGGALAWGRGSDGQLGFSPGICECSAVPVTVPGLTGARALAAGSYHSLALLSNGTVEAWGDDVVGQLGDGKEVDRATPEAVPGLTGVSDIDASDYGSFAVLSPTRTLKVNVNGTGSGAVGGGRILCPASTCEGVLPDGRVAILRAQPAAGSAFTGFSGACSGTGPCRVTMGQDQTVTATFNLVPPSGTRITSAKIDPKRRSARFSFEAQGIVSGFECKLVRPKPKKKARKLVARFSKCSSPKSYRHLKPGAYRFEVRAFNTAGKDAKPARRAFKVKAVKRMKPKRA